MLRFFTLRPGILAIRVQVAAFLTLMGIFTGCGVQPDRSANSMMASLFVNSNNYTWTWIVQTNSALGMSPITFICCVTNAGSESRSLREPIFGPSVLIFYREIGRTNYSSGIPPGTYQPARIVDLLPAQQISTEKQLYLTPGDYELYYEYFVSPSSQEPIRSALVELHLK